MAAKPPITVAHGNGIGPVNRAIEQSARLTARKSKEWVCAEASLDDARRALNEWGPLAGKVGNNDLKLLVMSRQVGRAGYLLGQCQ